MPFRILNHVSNQDPSAANIVLYSHNLRIESILLANQARPLLCRSVPSIVLSTRRLASAVGLHSFRPGQRPLRRLRPPHGKIVLCVADGRWFDRQDGSWRDDRGRRTTRPRQTLSASLDHCPARGCHLDHDPTNSELENLAAWCQRCHLLHDRPEHRRRAAITVLLRRAMGDLFLGAYRI